MAWRIFALFFFTSVAFAQNPRGSLVGTVQDTSGARVAGAGIEVKSSDSAIDRLTTGNSEGQFRIDALPPGTYKLIVNKQGFSEAQSDVTVFVSTAREVNVTLTIASPALTVTVQGSAASITTEPMDTTGAVHQGIVTAQDLRTIPLAARSFANIAYLVPGTEPVEPSDPTKARITAVSTGGSSGLNNQLSVDGGDNSDDYIGGFLQNFSPDTIEEFVFQTANEDADIGGTTSSAVVITTKRGTDDWHSDVAFYERSAALNARFPIDNPAPDPKQPFSRQNYVATLGGPIAKQKLYFFGGIEAVDEHASIAYSPASQAQFNALAALASQGLIPGAGSVNVPSSAPVPFHDYMGDIRLDWNQSSKSQWFVRYAAENYTTQNALVQQGTLPSTGATAHSNYMNMVLNNSVAFSPSWFGALTIDGSYLHSTEARNQTLGFALAFPFSATSRTVSGFETFGDNQFVTPITAFPVLRNQEKYQFRYDVSHTSGHHAPRFGVNFIHEPVLSGALAANPENLTIFPLDPADYLANPAQFTEDLTCGPNATPGTTCTSIPAGNGSFSQNVQRLGLYVQDSWRTTPHLTVNYGLRYDTSFGLFTASGRTQADNPAVLTLKALGINNLVSGPPQDYRHAFAPRLGIAYSPGHHSNMVIRAGFGMYYNDLAQNGWVSALQAVNTAPATCVAFTDPGCLPGMADGGAGAVIGPNYKTPYNIHSTAGVEYAFNSNWMASADVTHEAGVHGFQAYKYVPGYSLFSSLFPNTVDAQQANVPAITVFRSGNRSRYDALMLHLQGNINKRLKLTVNYTLSRADTWGCVLGELFDYVDGICNPLHAFGPGDFGPSGEDVPQRLVVAGGGSVPGGFELNTLFQAESGRPITLTTPLDVNGFGDSVTDRAVVNGVQTRLDEFRGTPYIQLDLRVSRPIRVGERRTLTPFVEFFNLFNRNNPGANYVTDISALSTPVNTLSNVTALCLNASCTQTQTVTNPKQLLQPAGALGDFFGPGTTVGIPFAAQVGARFNF